MSHSLWPLMTDARSVSKLVQGVTTEIMGEGYTPAPFGGLIAPPELHPDAPPGWPERIRSWSRFGDWLGALERRGVSPNVGSFLGGGTLREYACGMRMGAPTAAELATMVRVAGRGDARRRVRGRLRADLPARRLRRHRRDRRGRSGGRPRRGDLHRPHPVGGGGAAGCDRREHRDRAPLGRGRRDVPPEGVGRSAELAADGRRAIERIEAARAAGLDVTADMYPYAASGTGLSARLPVSLAADGLFFERLAEPGVRDRVREQLAAGTDEVDDPGAAGDHRAGGLPPARAPAVRRPPADRDRRAARPGLAGRRLRPADRRGPRDPDDLPRDVRGQRRAASWRCPGSPCAPTRAASIRRLGRRERPRAPARVRHVHAGARHATSATRACSASRRRCAR